MNKSLKKLKVLMQIRDNYLLCPGGDTIQLFKTKEYLEKIGIDVKISTELQPILDEYDIVHLFNLTRIQETYIQMKNAILQNKPIALSTIYWPFHEMNRYGYEGLRKVIYNSFSGDSIERIKALYKYIYKNERNKGCLKLIFGTYSKMQKDVLNNADICLPNAETEMKKISEYLGINNLKYEVVPNGVDSIKVKQAINSNDIKYKKYKDYIICVARISRRKNQILLLDAIKDCEYKILFVGKKSPGELDYYKKFIKLISNKKNVDYIENISNDELYLLYKWCKVSVLPSWFETPGLVNIEAAAMGCNIVVTDKGTTRDYFGDYAFYCDINNKDSIRNQIELAYKTPYNEELRKKY